MYMACVCVCVCVCVRACVRACVCHHWVWSVDCVDSVLATQVAENFLGTC